MLIETIFFDRDGIINDIVLRDNLVSSPRNIKEFHIKEEFITFYAKLSKSLNLFVVSNQPDISRCLTAEDDLLAMNSELYKQFSFKEITYCPHDNKDNCECRKPKPGMINQMISKYGLSKSNSIIVGDSNKDILAGQAAGIKTIYWQQYYNLIPNCKPDFVIQKLSDMLGILKQPSD